MEDALYIVVIIVFMVIFFFAFCVGGKVNDEPARGEVPQRGLRLEKAKFEQQLLDESSLESIALKKKYNLTETVSVITISIGQEHIDSPEYLGLSTVIEALTKVAAVFIIQYAHNDDEESRLADQTMRLLNSLLPRQRLLFCGSHVGKIAIMRQLRPHVHCEYEDLVAEQLAPHMRVFMLSPPGFSSAVNGSTKIGNILELIT